MAGTIRRSSLRSPFSVAAVPYAWGLAIWLVASFAAYLAAIRAILPRPETLLVAAAFPAVFVNIGHGQTELVVPPAWAVLYLTIGVSGWLVWRMVGFAAAVLPFVIYLVQLILNAAWSPIFFGMQRPDLAFIEIVILWFSIVVTIAAFHPISAAAAWLLLPYLAWVTFAGALVFLFSGPVASATAQ